MPGAKGLTILDDINSTYKRPALSNPCPTAQGDEALRFSLGWRNSNLKSPLTSKSSPNQQMNERQKRWWDKLRSDPERWAKRMENQRKKRQRQDVRERERQQAREKYAATPKDHPRKRRKCRAKPESRKAKRKRDMEKLPDAVVANQYLHMKVSECPKSLIEIKRQHIRLTRMLGTNIKTV